MDSERPAYRDCAWRHCPHDLCCARVPGLPRCTSELLVKEACEHYEPTGACCPVCGARNRSQHAFWCRLGGDGALD